MPVKRPAAVAGIFYPDEPAVLEKMLDEFLVQNRKPGPAPKALIAPHAGYIYSGPIAASAYSRLSPVSDRIKRVVLLGPAHRVGFPGLAVHSADYFSTPLGDVTIDKETTEALLQLDFVTTADQAHAPEHSLEVHLPFLQYTLDSFVLTPVLVGFSDSDQAAAAINQVWGQDDTLILVSSDLSHYHDYATARHMDSLSSQAIEALNPSIIDADHACGYLAVNGLLKAADTHGLQASTLDLRNSGDTAGDRSRVVGYGAYAFVPSAGEA